MKISSIVALLPALTAATARINLSPPEALLTPLQPASKHNHSDAVIEAETSFYGLFGLARASYMEALFLYNVRPDWSVSANYLSGLVEITHGTLSELQETLPKSQFEDTDEQQHIFEAIKLWDDQVVQFLDQLPYRSSAFYETNLIDHMIKHLQLYREEAETLLRLYGDSLTDYRYRLLTVVREWGPYFDAAINSLRQYQTTKDKKLVIQWEA